MEIRDTEIRCPCCRNVIAQGVGDYAVTAFGKRMYAVRRLIEVTCEGCGSTWAPAIRGAGPAGGPQPKTLAVSLGKPEPPPGPATRPPDVQNVVCQTPNCGRVLAQIVDGRALISHRHRIIWAQQLLQVNCDRCPGGWQAETAPAAASEGLSR